MQKIRNFIDESLLAVDPYKAVSHYRDYVLSRYEKEKLNKLYVVSFGKIVLLDSKRFVFFIRKDFL
jgi:hypothetical protein